MVAIGLIVAALAVAARGLERRTTWYLASDQFAFLTFATDLARGRIFHDPAVVALLASPELPPSATADALSQTYFFGGGRLWSRYPPGYPLLLALAGAAGGETGRHLLNPILYLGLIVLIALAAARLLGTDPARVRWAAAATAPWLMLLVPADIHYWGLTVARDLPAHILGLASLVAAARARFGHAGLLLGASCTIRPDAILYGASIAALAAFHRPRLRALPLAAAAFVAGALPLFAYNVITGGGPLHFSQGLEFRELLGALDPAGVALAQTAPATGSGGGFRLSNLRHTLPLHVIYLWQVFGPFAVSALATLVWSTRRRPVLAAALAPYTLLALVFYSCWGHADARYLVGASLGILLAAGCGIVLWCASLGERRPGLAAATAVIAALVWSTGGIRDTVPARAVAAGATIAGAAALIGPAVGLTPLVPAAALAAVGVVRAATGSGTRDPFQHEQVIRARATIEGAIPPGAVVLTTPALGRPAENIGYYTHAEAHYVGEVTQLGSSVDDAVRRLAGAGRQTFLLLGAAEPLPLADTALRDRTREVMRANGPALYDWFVDPRRIPAGAVLYEVAAAPG